MICAKFGHLKWLDGDAREAASMGHFLALVPRDV
jgi:hypothetical protein